MGNVSSSISLAPTDSPSTTGVIDGKTLPIKPTPSEPIGDSPQQGGDASCRELSEVGIVADSAVLVKVDQPAVEVSSQSVIANRRFPQNLPAELELVLGQDAKAYAIMRDTGNAYVLPVGSGKLNNVIREIALNNEVNLRRNDLSDINSFLQAHAETVGTSREIWFRVAASPDGVVIDIGDDCHAHVKISPGKVDIIESGSEVLFYRSSVTLPMAYPAEEGDINLLRKYLNVHPVSIMLLIAWITYTMALPKVSTSNYVILVLQGDQGSGKTSLCNNVLRNILDPNRIGVQVIPRNSKDLAIAAKNAHVLYYDNVREITQAMADLLCITATGGALSSRELYTDSGQQVLQLHVGTVLTSIHSFVDQPDLAQRCLPIDLLTIKGDVRKSEATIVNELQDDLPAIMKGVFNLIADILMHLPNAEVTHPERMYDFSRWLAAYEVVDGVPSGTYQLQYSDAINQGQLDSLMDNPLAAAVLDLAKSLRDYASSTWSGTPTELHSALRNIVTVETTRSKDWPRNPISLSKRLKPLKASLLTQGVEIEFSRGVDRQITITTTNH